MTVSGDTTGATSKQVDFQCSLWGAEGSPDHMYRFSGPPGTYALSLQADFPAVAFLTTSCASSCLPGTAVVAGPGEDGQTQIDFDTAVDLIVVVDGGLRGNSATTP